jgi:hypothetical protein
MSLSPCGKLWRRMYSTAQTSRKEIDFPSCLAHRHTVGLPIIFRAASSSSFRARRSAERFRSISPMMKLATALDPRMSKDLDNPKAAMRDALTQSIKDASTANAKVEEREDDG